MTKGVHLAPVLAGIAVLLLSGAGIMSYLGWLPTPGALTKSMYGSSPELTAATVRCGRCGWIEAVREIGNSQGASSRTLAAAAAAQHLGGFSSLTNVLGLLVVAVPAPAGRHETVGLGVYQTTVRFDDGSTRVVTEVNPPLRKPGDLVKVVSGRIFAVPESAPEAVVDASR